VKRENLEHLIRSAGAISECKEIIVIGRKQILYTSACRFYIYFHIH